MVELAKKKTKRKPKKNEIKVELIIRKVPKSKQFVLADGRKLSDIKELAFALGDMADEVFWHHVNEFKNDFACWLEDSLDEKKLAAEIASIKDKINSQIIVLKHIVNRI